MKKRILIPFLFIAIYAFSAPIKIACIGDSITEGWNGNPSYVPILQQLLGSDYTVENDGRSGATVLKKGNVPYWNQNAFSKAMKSDADIITMMLGTNDTKSKNWESYSGEFKSDYCALIDTIQAANKNAKIFLVIPVPVCRDNYGIRKDVLEKEILIMKEIAKEKNLAIIDANTPLLFYCTFFEDGVHPKLAAADKIAHVLFESIKSN